MHEQRKIECAVELPLSLEYESINCISNPLSMISFCSSSNELNVANVVESNSRDFKTTKESDLLHLRLGHPNMLVHLNMLSY